MIAYLVFALPHDGEWDDEILVDYSVDDEPKALAIVEKAEKTGLYRNVRMGSCDLDKLPKSN